MFEVVAYVSKKLHTMSEKKEISVCMDYQTVEGGGAESLYGGCCNTDEDEAGMLCRRQVRHGVIFCMD